MPYLGRPVTNAGQFEIIDDISSGFNGSETSFTLQVGGTDIQPDVANVTITLGGVYQVPSSAYSITGSAINFSEAPESNTTFHGVLAGQSQFIESDFITNTMIKSTAAISGSKIDTDFSAQSFQLTNVTASGDISGSGVSTGSFGKVEVGSGKITTTGNMVLDADGAQIRLEDGGTEFGRISRVSSDLVIKSISNNNDILFKGVDGSSTITALQLDMSDAGTAIFNNDVTIAGTLTAQEFHTEFTSASIVFSSGSTLFGDSSDDVHEFRGNLISGSATSTASLAMISLADKIEHIGDTNNTIEFGTDEIKLRTGGSSRLIARDANVELYNNLIVAGTIAGSDDITLDNNKYYQVKATGGSAIRIAGLANDNNIYLGAIDDAGASVYIREDGSNVLSFTGGKASFANAVTSSLLLVEGVSNYQGIEIKGSGASRPQLKFRNVNQGTLGQIYGTEGNALVIATGTSGTTAITIDSSQNVGIGSSSPTAKLDVNGGATINGNTIVGRGGEQKGRLTIQSRTGTATRKTNAIVAVPYNDTSESICMIGMDGQAGNNEMHIGSNTSDFMSPTYIDFFTASDVNSQTNNRAMRIDNTGAVLFNTTTRTSTGNGGATFDPNSVGRAVLNLGSVNYTSELDLVRLFNDNGEVGDIRTNGSGASFNSNSDYRLKENQVTLSNALTRLNNLKPYRFNFKADPSTTLDGFFAHEVQEVVPEAVTGTKDQMKPIQYQPGDDIPEGKEVYDIKEYSTTEIDAQKMDASKLVPLLVAALQEADDKIDALTTRIEVLEG